MHQEPTPEALACTCAHVADDRKADAIVVLNVGKTAFFTDHFVIATGRNARQIRAIAEEILRRLKDMDRLPIGTEGDAESGWVLLDLGEVVVHLLSPEARALYDLELLWGEAPRLPWQDTEPLEDIAESRDHA